MSTRDLSAATKAKYSKPNIYRGFIARFPRAIEAVARVSEYGTVKHELPLDDVSFTGIPDAKYVFIEAECRHLINEAKNGPVNHEDGGMLHKAQKAWDALADLEIFMKEQENSRASKLGDIGTDVPPKPEPRLVFDPVRAVYAWVVSD